MSGCRKRKYSSLDVCHVSNHIHRKRSRIYQDTPMTDNDFNQQSSLNLRRFVYYLFITTSCMSITNIPPWFPWHSPQSFNCCYVDTQVHTNWHLLLHTWASRRAVLCMFVIPCRLLESCSQSCMTNEWNDNKAKIFWLSWLHVHA